MAKPAYRSACRSSLRDRGGLSPSGRHRIRPHKFQKASKDEAREETDLDGRGVEAVHGVGNDLATSRLGRRIAGVATRIGRVRVTRVDGFGGEHGGAPALPPTLFRCSFVVSGDDSWPSFVGGLGFRSCVDDGCGGGR
jgi:hypothetical protein